jgi:hypothetical protein
MNPVGRHGNPARFAIQPEPASFIAHLAGLAQTQNINLPRLNSTKVEISA